MNSKHSQAGYMLEIPLIMAAVGTLLAILLPRLPAIAGKALVLVGALILIGGSYYMIVIPGWQPGNASHLRWPWNLLIFILVALAISLAAGALTWRREWLCLTTRYQALTPMRCILRSGSSVNARRMPLSL